LKTGIKTNCLTLTIGLLMVARANALISSGIGSPPYSTGWPEGAAAVSNLKSCVGWWEGPPFGGGEWHIQFRGDADALNQALTNFTAIKCPVLDLVLHDGPKHDQFLELDKQNQPGTDSRVDWNFVVWNTNSWNSIYNTTNTAWIKVLKENDPNFGKPMPPPQLDIYIGDGSVDWKKVKVPANVNVRDERSKNK
jgi:hypothetical protein